jgi:polyhydroxyalkanoate synthase subunit PhaE
LFILLLNGAFITVKACKAVHYALPLHRKKIVIYLFYQIKQQKMAKNATKATQNIQQAVEMQRKAVKSTTKVAKELTKDLPLVQETIDQTYNAYEQGTNQATKVLVEMALMADQTTEQIKNTMDSTKDFFKNWFENQMTFAKTWYNTADTAKTTDKGNTDWTAMYENWTKQMQDAMANNPMATMMNMDWMKNNPMMNMMQNNPMANMMNMEWMKNNPMATMMNMDWMKNNPMANMMNMEWMKNNPMMGMMNNNPMMSMMQNMMQMDAMKNMSNMFTSNPMMNMTNMNDAMSNGMSTWNGYMKQYLDMMNTAYGDWTKNIGNMTSADSFKGMFNMVEGMKSFYTMWEPFMKQMQDGKFNVDEFMGAMKAGDYKTFVDKFFGFMPDSMRQQSQAMNQMWVENMKKMSEQGMTSYNYLSGAMQNNPMMNMNPYAGMMTAYTQMRDQAISTMSPLTNLMQDTTSVKNAKVWSEIADKLTTFNIKNAELQAMMYKQGLVAMEETAKNVYNKIQNGENFDSIVKVYQEWMMNSDKVYINLFESDEYSKLMTEVSSLQMKLKHNMDEQMETMLSQMMPVATRTQLDEIYKAMYDLKKEVRGTKTPTPASVKPATATVAKKAAPAKKPAPAKKAAKKK